MAETPAHNFDDRVGAVRRFNRLYTRRIGVLEDGFLGSPYSLTQARVLYELARRPKSTATEIAAELGLDHGYLSRILRDFDKRGLLVKTALPHDRRQALLSLTAKGRMAFAPLEQHSQEQVGAMLGALSVPDPERAVAARRTTAKARYGPTPCLPPRAGSTRQRVSSSLINGSTRCSASSSTPKRGSWSCARRLRPLPWRGASARQAAA